MPESPNLASELRATLSAREELGQHYEPALVESFIESLDRSLDAKVAAAVEARRAPRRGRSGMVPIFSVALGIPISAVVANDLHGPWGFLGLVVSWCGIAAVNIAHSVTNRR